RLEHVVVEGAEELREEQRAKAALAQELVLVAHFRIARQTVSGVAGMETSRTPRSASASTIAFMTAAGAGVVPPSPPALMPKGLVGESTSTISLRSAGTSAARSSA